MTERMNSKEYWDNRFATRDWEEHDGEGQSTFFARLAVKNFPEWLSTELNQNEWEFRDYGCATGEGTAYLARCFPSCIMTGIDISEEAVKQASEKTPNCEFVAGDITESIQETDVVFSSNTLEHLKKPKKLLKMLVQSAKKYAILLLPFEDDLGIEEHFNMFEASFFPMTIESHALCCMRIIDCRNTETGLKYWNGKQILVVYVNTAYRSLESGLIADFYKENVSNLQDERLLLQEQIKDTTDKIKKYENQLQEQREENDRQYKVISEKEIEYQNNLLNKEAEFQEERNEWKRTEQQRIAEFQTERDKLKQDVQQKVAEKEAEFQIERDEWKKNEQQRTEKREIEFQIERDKWKQDEQQRIAEREAEFQTERDVWKQNEQKKIAKKEAEFRAERNEWKRTEQQEIAEKEARFHAERNIWKQNEQQRVAEQWQKIEQIKQESMMLSFWLDVAGRSKPLRLAHFIIQCKHAMIGTPEEKAESRRWLRGDRSFVPKYSYLHQSAVHAAALQAKLCEITQNGKDASSSNESDRHLNGYEYKYLRFLNRRDKQFQLDFTKFAVPNIKNMVSVVLPVYNGDDMIEESIKSVLIQTYKNFELIIVDDGSTDKTPRIVDKWAKRDRRIRVIHQANAKLPRALNRGFSCAKGEFLTWTSADNRMHKDFLEKLVDYMQRNPKIAMCYANLRAIDVNGDPLRNNGWYPREENNGNVYLPNAVLRLNTYPENTVAAAFMYRRAIPKLLGGYDPNLYTVEDYDYWMRINDFCGLHHTDFEDVIYDYRFHDKSLTSKAKELRINEMREKLMLMEDYRQDWIIRPVCWLIEEKDLPWQELAKNAGDIFLTRNDAKRYLWPKLGTGVIQICFAQNGAEVAKDECITEDAIRVLVRKGKVREEDKQHFDLLVQISTEMEDVPEGWIRASDEQTAFSLIKVYCKARWFDEMIKMNRVDHAAKKKATIVLCTYKRTAIAKKALEAMAAQSMNKDDYEILVVNNDPKNREMRQIICDKQRQCKTKKFYRYIDCPYPGLSAARNFSLYAANGEVVLYVDDDGIMDRDCLRRIVNIFEKDQNVGVGGGSIRLKEPERFKNVILPGYEGLWSERKYQEKKYFEARSCDDYPYGCNYAIRRTILREMGGFRTSYGRVGKDFAGGEEVVLSHLVCRAGMKIGIDPTAIVTHDVEPSRYTLEHVQQTIRSGRLTNRLMKMDLYKPYDIGMTEEYHYLNISQEKIKWLEENGVSKDDLRYVYAQAELEAAKEAIQAGEKDIKIMNEYVKN